VFRDRGRELKNYRVRGRDSPKDWESRESIWITRS
jgi:hypothetical protein